MQFKNILLTAFAGTTLAQSGNMSLCDKYTTALLKTNNASNQYTVLTLLVNTVVIGSYSPVGNLSKAAGILANGTVDGEAVSLLKYFDGTLQSTNRGDKAVSINFLDDGGAVPLMMNKPANGTSSNQYKLLTHLYEFFGILLGCSGVGQMGFPAYGGDPSMYKVHKFMALSSAQNTYFIQQVGAAALSFGVTMEDATTVGQTLAKVFNYRCSPATALTPNGTATLNSICLASSCPIDPAGSNCTAYNTVNNNGTASMPSAAPRNPNGTVITNSTGTGTGTGSSASATSSRAAAATLQVATSVGLSALIFALFAM